MRDEIKEPIFTAKGWAAIALLGCVYAAILFSLDPEWVAWAAPLAFGGALYAPGPAPASFQVEFSGHGMFTAYGFGVASLIALELLVKTAGKSRPAWLHRLLSGSTGAWLTHLRSYGKPKSVASH